jgi:hypothetical protein
MAPVMYAALVGATYLLRGWSTAMAVAHGAPLPRAFWYEKATIGAASVIGAIGLLPGQYSAFWLFRKVHLFADTAELERPQRVRTGS